jgi:hypothetical protein
MLTSDKIMHTLGEAEETVLLQAREQWAPTSSQTVTIIHVIDMEKLPFNMPSRGMGRVPPKRRAPGRCGRPDDDPATLKNPFTTKRQRSPAAFYRQI